MKVVIRLIGLLTLTMNLLALSIMALPKPPFNVPWIGYNVGSSAYNGNPSPFERDPSAVATADFDGDGDPDIVVANTEYAAPGGRTNGMSGFVVLFNDGSGGYGPPTYYTVSNKGCWDVAVGDFDEDGDVDVIVPVADTFWETGNTVVLFLNDGTGAFPISRTFTVGGQAPTGITVADFDGDGHLDAATVSYQFPEMDGRLSVLKGTGAGQFAPHVTYTVNARPFKLQAGDLNGDGRQDIVVAHDWQGISVLLNNGTGSFSAPVVYDQFFPLQGGMYYGAVTLCDSDRDGDLDVFYSNSRSHPVGQSTPRIVHLRNDGGALTRLADIMLTANASGPSDLVTADFNGDSWPDLAGASFESGGSTDGLRVVLNDGGGGFGPAQMISAGQANFALAAADVDRDGDDDILAADRFSMAVTVNKNPGDGLFPVLATRYPSGTHSTLHLVTGDVDGDGDLDLFTSGEILGVPGALLRNNGDGTLAAPVTYTHSTTYGRGVANAKLRDLDGDGDLDLLYNDAHTDFFTGYDFWVGLNDGIGTFGPLMEWDLNTCGNGDIDAIDLDHDGDLDVVNLEQLGCGGSNDPQRIFIRLNNGDATFQPVYSFFIGRIPRDLGHGDFNDDGNVDLVTAHWGVYGANDFINVHIGNGDGTFQEEIVYNVGKGPRYVVVADLNGDGHHDFATANSSDENYGRETLTVLFGTGFGTFTGRTDYYAPYSPDLQGVSGVEAGDVDGDGDLDLMMATVANGLAMYYNDGAGGFTFPHRLGVYWGPWGPVYADFTGDGVPDVALIVSAPPSLLTSEIAIMRGGLPPTPTSTPTPTTTPTSTPPPSISGTITYGNGADAPPRFVSNVNISATGASNLFTTTGFPGGDYSLSGFLVPGTYVVSPTKTTGVNGISSFDAARVAQHVAGINVLTGTQFTVADASGNSSLSSFDAGLIARYVAGQPDYGLTTRWVFQPPNRIYSDVTANITDQNYTALLMGEVSGNWTNTGARESVGSRQLAKGSAGRDARVPADGIAVELPSITGSVDKEIVVSVNVQNIADRGVISYEFDLRYDPSVMQPDVKPVDIKGTVSRGLTFVTNTQQPGLLRVVAYGPMPIDSDGVLLKLRFTAVGNFGAISPLTFERFMFNEGLPLRVTDGSVDLQ